MINYSAFTYKGIKKEKNDDRILVDNNLIRKASCQGSQTNKLLTIVCDGVGSSVNGSQAANLIANSFKGFDIDLSSPSIVRKHLNKVNADIMEKQLQDNTGFSMASTVAGLIIYENSYMIFNLGDTRVYRMSSGDFIQMSHDHTVRNDTGYLFFGDVKNKDALTRYIGADGKACSPFITRGRIKNDSTFILCSDGVYKFIPDNVIKDVLLSDMTLNEKADKICRLAVEAGSTDDISIVVLDCSIGDGKSGH